MDNIFDELTALSCK